MKIAQLVAFCMTAFLAIGCFSSLSLQFDSVKGSGKLVSEERTIPPFHQLSASGSVKVLVGLSEKISCEVKGDQFGPEPKVSGDITWQPGVRGGAASLGDGCSLEIPAREGPVLMGLGTVMFWINPRWSMRERQRGSTGVSRLMTYSQSGLWYLV